MSQRAGGIEDVARTAMGRALNDLDVLLRVGSAAGLSDTELLGRFLQARDVGAEAAFEALVRRHGPMVLATGRGVLRDLQQAEDVFQATFLVLARRAGGVRDRERLGPWLHRVALRIAVRARSAAVRRPDQEELLPGADVMAGTETDHQEDRATLIGQVHEEVDRLPERYRAAVVLCYLQGASYETAAARLRMPVGTVRSRLARARERLRQRLARRLPGLHAGVVVAALTADAANAAIPNHLVGPMVKAATVVATGKLTAVAGGGAVSARALTYACAYSRPLLGGSGAIGLKTSVLAVAIGMGAGGAAVGLLSHHRRHEPPPAARAASSPAPEPPDVERLQGAWIVLAYEQGRPPGSASAVGDVLVLGDGRFKWMSQTGAIVPRSGIGGVVALDPTAVPPRIDLVLEDPRSPTTRPLAFRGIYRLEANRLTLCLGHPKSGRLPAAFAIEGDPGLFLLTLKRVVTIQRPGPTNGGDRREKGKETP